MPTTDVAYAALLVAVKGVQNGITAAWSAAAVSAAVAPTAGSVVGRPYRVMLHWSSQLYALPPIVSHIMTRLLPVPNTRAKWHSTWVGS